MSLIPGQIVKLNEQLYRVDYVNSCRAHITPIGKRYLEQQEDVPDEETNEKTKPTTIRGLNISPNSTLTVVTDIERALDEIELRAAERELAQIQNELQEEEERDLQEMKAAEAELAAAQAEMALVSTRQPRTAPTVPSRGAGWQLATEAVPLFKAGTLAAEIMGIIAGNPGLTTKEIVERATTAGAIAACVSRFAQAGYIKRC